MVACHFTVIADSMALRTITCTDMNPRMPNLLAKIALFLMAFGLSEIDHQNRAAIDRMDTAAEWPLSCFAAKRGNRSRRL